MRKLVFISIGGGKGGVGKTFFSTTLGVLLAEKGFKTLILDFDLGGANVHTFLGMEPSALCLDKVIGKERRRVDDIIVPSPVDNLYVVVGARENYRSMSINNFTKNRMLKEVRKMDFDYVIADLGAGTSLFTLDVFVNSDLSIGIVSPESVSTENFFRFMKCAFYRKVDVLWRKYRRYFENSLIEMESIRYPQSILTQLEMQSPQGGALVREGVESMKFAIVLNMITRGEEVGRGDMIKKLAGAYLGVNLLYLGWIPFCEKVRTVMNGGVPLIYRIDDWNLKESFSQIALSITKFTESRNGERGLLSFARGLPGSY